MKSLRGIIRVFTVLLLWVAAAQAGISGTAVFEVAGFLVKDSGGNVLDFDADFDLLNWTGPADEDVVLDNDTDALQDANTTTGVNFPVICVGDCSQIAPDVFPVVSGTPAADYSTADQRETDAPITGPGSFDTPANVGNGAY